MEARRIVQSTHRSVNAARPQHLRRWRNGEMRTRDHTPAMKKLFLLFLTLPLIYLSCHKEEETKPTTKTESKIIDSIWHLEYCVSEVYKRINSTTVVNNPFQRQYSNPISYCTDHYSESAHLEFPSDSTFTYIHMPLIREYDITEQKVDNFGNTTFQKGVITRKKRGSNAQKKG